MPQAPKLRLFLLEVGWGCHQALPVRADQHRVDAVPVLLQVLRVLKKIRAVTERRPGKKRPERILPHLNAQGGDIAVRERIVQRLPEALGDLLAEVPDHFVGLVRVNPRRREGQFRLGHYYPGWNRDTMWPRQ